MVVELTNDIPKDSTILQGLRATRGVRMTAETATSVFVKWPALANQRYVSVYTLYVSRRSIESDCSD